MAASRANRSRSPSRGVTLARKIVIVPMQGRRFTLDVLGSDTIDSVKEKIYDHTSAVMTPWFGIGLVPELQRLKYYRPPLGNQDCEPEHYHLLLAIKIAGGCYFCKGIFKLFDLHDTGGWNVFSIFTMIIWEVLEGCTLIRQRRIRKNQVSNLDPMPRCL